MLQSRIDHIVVTAPSLTQGRDYLRQALGVEPQAGGEHPGMGTHNCLLRLGDDLYLEVIAADPQAPAPPRPRWFQLDDAHWNSRPQLATWVVRSNDIYGAAQAASPLAPGAVQAMTRAGLDWLITIPEDGALALQGAAPALIQWRTQAHPASGMQDAGCSLIRLEAFHPQAAMLSGMLDSIGFEGRFAAFPLEQGRQPYLIAHIQTPAGPRRLGGI
ncbi:VOC family protein [Pollutimonas bauzanensis]|uniref:Glyoxalase-like domain-containing protein n=1 Tax=Pollutimonas bauzanensis TaxID=658167 RepID=A0A1M5X019_9BURK|nr:VOC family protein [Pollutimonas bauzanensis]SHH92962.1 Glyoxalase-like domain-containing protein [Pollutimonas bauzanensis]